MQRTPEEYKAAYLHHKNAGNAEKAARVAQLYRQQLAGNNGSYQSPLPSPYANQAAAPQAKDGAFGYSVDQAQRMAGKGIEAAGRAFNSKAIADYGTGVVKQQDRDIAIGRYTPSYTKSLRETYNQDGLGAAAGWLGEKTAENAASAGTALGGAALTAITAPASMPLAAILGGATTLGSAAMGAGEAAFEQEEKTGDYDAKLASGVGVLIGVLDKFGAGKVIPKDRLMKMTAEQISAELSKKGFGEAAKTVLKRTGAEALTENAQEGLSIASAAARGGEYTLEELGDRALEAAALGGTTSLAAQGGMGTLGAATNLVRGSNTSAAPADQEAAASFAQRLAEIAEANGYDLQDIDKMSSQGARETVDKAHIQYTEDLKQLFADLKSRVAVTDQDSLEEVAQKVLAAAAYREGRNKTKSTVGVQEMSALESLAGDTREGQEALSVLRQLNQLTKLHNDGYQGGVSAITDQFGPLGGKIGYDKGAVATERLLRPVISGSAAISTGGTSLIGQLALQGTGRMIDKVTGRRSVVDRFVKQNQGQSGIPGSTSPSLREESIAAEQAAAQEAEALQAQQEAQAQQQAQEEANLNEYVYNQGGLPNDQSPAGRMSSVLGIDPEQMMTMLDEIIATEPNPQIVDAAIAAQGSIVKGGFIPNLNQLISMMKLRVNPDPQFWIERDRSAGQAAAQTNLSRQEQNYQRGIENNQAFNQELQNAVDDDGSIPPLNKAHLKVALADLARDLGAQPLDMVNSIIERAVEKGVTQEQMQAYLAPYLERVQQQQDAKNSRDQAAAEVDADPINESRGIPLIEQAATAERKQRAEEQGFDTSKVYYHGTYASYVENTAYESFDNPNSMPGINRVGTWLDDSPQNYAYLDGRANDVVYPVYIKNTKGFDIGTSYVGTVDPFDRLTQFIAADKDIELRSDGAIPPNAENNQKIDEWSQSLRDMGYTHINLLGTSIDSGLTDGKPRNFTIVLDPKNIRSVNAQFDPAEAGSDRLVANKTPVLQLDTREGKKHGVPRIYTVESEGPVRDNNKAKSAFVKKLDVKNFPKVNQAMQELSARHEDALSTPDAWLAFERDLLGDNETPAAPTGLINLVNDVDKWAERHGQLSGDQLDAAKRGFETVEGMKQIYADGTATVDTTGKLMAWGIMSRMLSAANQEAGFVDAVLDGKMSEFIARAVERPFTAADVKEYKKWVSGVIPSGSFGKPSTSNLNDFGAVFLKKLSVKQSDGRSGLEHLHDMISNPEVSSADIRRTFYGLADGVGIANKVLSFVLLMMGRTDVVVLDRIQINSMWDSAKYGKLIYDDVADLFSGAHGLARYEALEKGLLQRIDSLYQKLGRPDDASVGRYHWESWVRDSGQVVAHPTAGGIYDESISGDVLDSYADLGAPEGRMNRYNYGAIYARDREGTPYFSYADSNGVPYVFSVESFNQFQEEIKKKSAGVIPKGFKVSEYKQGYPWYEAEGVNREKLDEKIHSIGKRAGSAESILQGDAEQRNANVSRQPEARQGQEDPVNPAIKPGTGILSSAVSDYFKQPTPAQIKEQVEPAEQITKFVLGKPGTEFENGLSTMDQYVELAKLLNVTVSVVDSMKGDDVGDGTLGFFQGMLSGTAGKIKILKDQTPISFLQTVAHEVGHALEGSTLDRLEAERSWSPRHNHPQASRAKGAYSARQNTLRDKMQQVLFRSRHSSKSQMRYNDGLPEIVEAKKIRKEIDELQNGTLVSFSNAPELGSIPIRDNYESYLTRIHENSSWLQSRYTLEEFLTGPANKPYKKHYDAYNRYKKGTEEFIVDPVHFYLMNPKQMKATLPETFKFLRDVFNKSSMPIEMHANPMMTVIALLLAGFGKALAGEEEEERPQGVLNPQPALLTT